jgi:hypothetical protein
MGGGWRANDLVLRAEFDLALTNWAPANPSSASGPLL